MIKKYFLTKENLDYDLKDYLSKTKLDLIRFHILLQVIFSIFLISYSITFRFKMGSIYGQSLILIVMGLTYYILYKDKDHKRASLLLTIFYTIVVVPSVNIALGSSHILPVLLSLYSIVIIVLLLEGKMRYRLLIAYILISIPISWHDMLVLSEIYGFSIAFNRFISLMLAFILIVMTVWVFKDTVIVLSNENYVNSIIDRLTGVYNYYSFEKELKKNINIYNRHDENFSIAMIDLDNFKVLNDNHGHQDGDKFLRAFVSHAKTFIRQEDFLARYGGDEFIILFPRSNKDLAVKVVERLYKESELLLKEYNDIEVSFSCGICDYHESIHLEEDIVKLADDRMYKAKELGKNRFVS